MTNKFYQKRNKRLQKETCEKYQTLSEEGISKRKKALRKISKYYCR